MASLGGWSALPGSHPAVVLGSNSLGKELFLLWRNLSSTETAFVSFKDAGDFLECSELLKARIAISKFSNCTGSHSTLKCQKYWLLLWNELLTLSKKLSSGSEWNNVRFMVFKSVISSRKRHFLVWQNPEGVNREGWSRPQETAARGKELLKHFRPLWISVWTKIVIWLKLYVKVLQLCFLKYNSPVLEFLWRLI